MKYILLGLLSVVLFASCADNKQFNKRDGSSFTAETYGWADYQEKKIEGVTYKVNIGNIVWSVLLSETIIVPIWLTGWELFEPVYYDEQIKTEQK